MDCIFSQLAEANLEEIADFIAKDNPQRALSFIREVRDCCQAIGDAPARVIVGEVDSLPVRKVLFGNYRIYYCWLEAEETIYIVHIRHMARQTPTFQTSSN